MTIKEVYEKYKHFDCLFADEEWMMSGKDIYWKVIFDLWQAIKEDQ